MNLQTGVDILEIERLRAVLERHGERFLQRVFTSREVGECRGRAEALAACFAAKEAAVKALGTGIGPVDWIEVETLHHPAGNPYLVLHGRAAEIARSLGLSTWAVSLSHSHSYAVAVVVAIGET